MRKFLQSSMLLLFAFSLAQNVSDYKYVAVPQKFKDFDENKFGLNNLLTEKLKAKNYTVLRGEMETWPAEARSNPCGILSADVLNTSSFLKNKIRVEFNDCNQTTVSSLEGKSNIKEYEAGYRDALELAINLLKPSNPTTQNIANNSTKPESQVVPQSPTTAAPQNPIKKEVVAQTPAKSESAAETFTNGSLNLSRIQIADDQFILANPNSSTPYAIFKMTGKKDVYRVQLQDGTQTFGYLENGNIFIETTNADGSAGKEVFSRK